MRVMANGDRFSATNMSLRGLIQYAYNIRMQEQVSGLSGWADSAAYDIEAKTDEEESAILKKLSPDARAEQGRLIMQGDAGRSLQAESASRDQRDAGV